ncbi:hypothetical protein EDB80DRAFT_34429 [Ilyonectria destructans]|nr:hypothetical protein EDB80DRAFT_34429 [Ilyonectria destructans]
MISIPHPPRSLIPAHMKTLFIPTRTPPPRRSKTGDAEPLHVLVHVYIHGPVSRLSELPHPRPSPPPPCVAQSPASRSLPRPLAPSTSASASTRRDGWGIYPRRQMPPNCPNPAHPLSHVDRWDGSPGLKISFSVRPVRLQIATSSMTNSAIPLVRISLPSTGIWPQM